VPRSVIDNPRSRATPLAQYHLGEKYILGLGLPQDKTAGSNAQQVGRSGPMPKRRRESASWRHLGRPRRLRKLMKVKAAPAKADDAKAAQAKADEAKAAQAKAKKPRQAQAKAKADEAKAAQAKAEEARAAQAKAAQAKAEEAAAARAKAARTPLEVGLEALQKGNYALALKELIPLANAGNAVAQLRLGDMNDAGQGVPKNAQRAAMRYPAGRRTGNGEAQFRLGEKFDADSAFR